MTSKDHDMTLDPIETDQTRAKAALAEQIKTVENETVKALAERLDASAHGVIADPELRLAPLYAALAKAQGAFPEIPKNRTATVRPQSGNAWSFKYSDLSDLINSTRPYLALNGLTQFQAPSEDLKYVVTTLAHSSGLSLVSHYPVKHKDGRMHPGQDWAISFAFARRYALSAVLGIASEETIEGDKSEKTSEDFKSGGGDGILSVRGVVVPPGSTQTEKAKLFATAIERKFDEAATKVGLDGVWERNVDVINTLQDHFPELHQNLLDVYKRCLDSIREGEG